MNAKTGTSGKCRVLGASVFICAAGIASGAHAAATITGIELLPGVQGGTLDSANLDNLNHTLSIDKTFTSLDPIVLRFTVGHGTGGGNSFSVSESVTNATGINWNDFHYSITNVTSNGVVFNSFASSTLSGFTLDPAPGSGPANLNYTGFLGMGGKANAGFVLKTSDPGAGKTFTFDLTETPSAVPLPASAWLFGAMLPILLPLVRRRTDAIPGRFR